MELLALKLGILLGSAIESRQERAMHLLLGVLKFILLFSMGCESYSSFLHTRTGC